MGFILVMQIDHQRRLRIGPFAHLDASRLPHDRIAPVCCDGQTGLPDRAVFHFHIRMIAFEANRAGQLFVFKKAFVFHQVANSLM